MKSGIGALLNSVQDQCKLKEHEDLQNIWLEASLYLNKPISTLINMSETCNCVAAL